MRIIVAGGRDFDDYYLLEEELKKFVSSISSEPTIVSGGARGADRLGEWWAFENECSLTIIKADWDKHKKAAGAIRNKKMADYSDALVAFWDGESRGTKNMIETAQKQGLLVKVVRY